MRIGVLALQGAFIEHIKILEKLGAQCIELRQKKDIDCLDGLVLPGGESTVQGKLLRELDMFDVLKEKIAGGLPVLATCAGLILLSETIVNDRARYFGTLPVKTRRNAYGRQMGSFEGIYPLKGFGNFKMTFIRAPYIESVGPEVEILAKVEGQITAVSYKNQIGLTFHPEMGNDDRIHKFFLARVSEK